MHFSSGQRIVYVGLRELSRLVFVSHQQTMMSTRSAPSTRLPPPDFHTLSCLFASVMANSTLMSPLCGLWSKYDFYFFQFSGHSRTVFNTHDSLSGSETQGI